MALKTVTKGLKDLILSGEKVFVTVVIGDEQAGGTKVKFKGSDTIKTEGEIVDFDLGSAANLKGQVLEVTTTVIDINPSTDHISITHVFEGCQPEKIVNLDTVDADGDLFRLKCTYTFK